MGHTQGLRRTEESVFSRIIEGQDTTKKSYDIGYKAEVAQNCRFSDEVGSVTKRSILAYYNTTELAGTGPIDSLYRYYKQSNSNQYLLQLTDNLLQVGDDSAGTFTTLKTFGASAQKRFTAVTYKDLAIVSTGYDPIMVTDGLAAWELGSCKAALKAEAGLITAGAHSYKVTFALSTYEITVRKGTTDGATTADKLLDSTANFGAEQYPTEVDMTVRNTTDDTETLIKAIDSTTVLSVQDNIFATGETYEIDIPISGEVKNGAVSNPVTTILATHGKVTLSNIPLGPTNCIARNIYRTAADGTEYKLLIRISDNSTETYEDNIADASLTTTYGSDTDDMPTGKYLHVTDERLFVSGNTTNGSYIYFSDQYLPHYFPSDNYDIVGENDGDAITGIKDLLSTTWVFKQNSIRPWFVSGMPETWSMGKVLSTIGCPAPYSIVNVQDGIVYQGWDHMYKFNGQYSIPIIDEFMIPEEILEVRRYESHAFFWNNLYLMAYTDLDDANTYHDRVLIWDTLRQQLSIDKGGAITQGAGNTQINCFAAMKGQDEWGQLYGGDSNRGFVYQYDRVINDVQLQTITDIDLGTHTSTMAVGEELNPILFKPVLDNMETYKTDELAQAAWVTSETTAKVPPDLGTGEDGAYATAADASWITTKNYTSVAITGTPTITVTGNVYIKVQGAFTNSGTINIDSGSTLYIWAYTVTNTGTIDGNVYIKANTITNSTGTLQNELIGKATHYPTGGSGGSLGYDANYATAHSVSGTGGIGTTTRIAVNCVHVFPTSATITKVKYKGAVTNTAGSYTNSYTSWSVTDDTGAAVLSAVGGVAGYSSSQAGAGSVSLDSEWTDTWASVKSLTTNSNDVVFYTENAVTMTCYIYDVQAWADIHCAYQTGVGTVPTSESITDFVNALEVFSETSTVNQGTYALKVLCVQTVTLDDTISKTINALDLSATAHNNILIDVYAQRAGTNFQLGLGESASVSYVNVPVAAANTWETVVVVNPLAAGTARDAVTHLKVKFTNVDSYNRVIIDNIRTGLYTGSSYLSQMFQVNAGTMGSLYWNENLAVDGATTYGEVLVYTRSSDDDTDFTNFTDDTGWSDARTDPSGSLITVAGDGTPTEGAMYFQFKIVLSSTDTSGEFFPWLYKADGYVIKATYWKLTTGAESSVIFRYKTGYRNFDLPFADKIYKKVVSVHEGSAGTFDLIADIRTATYTFSAISLTTFANRWVSNFPASMYAPELSLEWYKNDANAFKIKQFGVIMEPTPLV